MDKTPYSTIINEVRREKGLTVEDMERITLTRNIMQIEAGAEKLNDMQINLFANVLGLSAEALKQGIRKDRKDVAGYLDVFKRQLQDAQTSEAYFLNAIQEMSKPERFVAQYQEVSNIQDKNISEAGYYYIFDKKEQHIVTDKNGNPQTYTSAIEALKAATELEQKFKTEEKQKNTSKQAVKNMPEETAPRM
jgi:hypothetical protein